MTIRSLLPCLLLITVLPAVNNVVAEPLDNIEYGSEGARQERAPANTSQMEMFMRLERLQQDQQQLLGKLEEQAHTIDGLKRRQRELYLDIDRRLTHLEREGGSGNGGYTSAPSGSSTNNLEPELPATGQTVSSSPVAAGNSGDPAKERTTYQQAFNLLRELRYEQAITAFRGFLNAYPTGVYAHMAQYWTGEANYTQRRFKQAISDYQQLIDNYPQSPKLAEAMLKMGYSQNELGDKATAMETMSTLEKRFPGSTEAGQARQLLLRLRNGQ